MYEVGKTEEHPNANRLAIIVNKNLLICRNIGEKKHSNRTVSCKIKLQGKTSLKLHKFTPLKVTIMMKVVKFYEDKKS